MSKIRKERLRLIKHALFCLCRERIRTGTFSVYMLGWLVQSTKVQASTKGTPIGKEDRDTAEALCEIIRDKRASIREKHAATHLAINSP